MKIQILFALVVVLVSVGYSDALINTIRQRFFGRPELPEGYFGTTVYNNLRKIPESTRFTKHTLLAFCKWLIAIENDLRNVRNNIDLSKYPLEAQNQINKGLDALNAAAKDFVDLMTKIAASLMDIRRIGEIPGIIASKFGQQLRTVFTSLYNAIRYLMKVGVGIRDILPTSIGTFFDIFSAIWRDLWSLPRNFIMFSLKQITPGPLSNYMHYQNNNMIRV